MYCVTLLEIMFSWFFLIFFFQAEDGIRDLYVTGVQTCALPICFSSFEGASANMIRVDTRRRLDPKEEKRRESEKLEKENWRSEERRVGKECRSRWMEYHYKKKIQATSVDLDSIVSVNSVIRMFE